MWSPKKCSSRTQKKKRDILRDFLFFIFTFSVSLLLGQELLAYSLIEIFYLSLASSHSPQKKKKSCMSCLSYKIYGFWEILWLPSYVSDTLKSQWCSFLWPNLFRSGSLEPQWTLSDPSSSRLFRVIIQYLSFNSRIHFFLKLFIFFSCVAFLLSFHFFSLFFAFFSSLSLSMASHRLSSFSKFLRCGAMTRDRRWLECIY